MTKKHVHKWIPDDFGAYCDNDMCGESLSIRQATILLNKRHVKYVKVANVIFQKRHVIFDYNKQLKPGTVYQIVAKKQRKK